MVFDCSSNGSALRLLTASGPITNRSFILVCLIYLITSTTILSTSSVITFYPIGEIWVYANAMKSFVMPNKNLQNVDCKFFASI